MRSSFLRAVTRFSLQRLPCLLAVTWLQAEALITSVCDLVLLSLEYNTFYGYETACSWSHIFIVEIFFVARFRIQVLRACLKEPATPAQAPQPVLGAHLPPAHPARALRPAAILSQAGQDF